VLHIGKDLAEVGDRFWKRVNAWESPTALFRCVQEDIIVIFVEADLPMCCDGTCGWYVFA
jgi:hypothetical protein